MQRSWPACGHPLPPRLHPHHKSLEPGVARRLERNPDYWNPALPYLDGIDVFHFVHTPHRWSSGVVLS